MTLKQWIINWLGIEKSLQAHFDAALKQHSQDLKQAYEKALSDQKADYENRSGLVLEAAMTASEKIAKMVSERGDSAIREYVQDQLLALEQAATGQLFN